MRIILLTLVLVVSLSLADDHTPETLRQSSYGIFMIDDSQIDGVMQISEVVGGGSRIVLTLNGLMPGDIHTAALYEGDCSPDQPLVLVLQTVGESLPEDPFVSITYTDIAYDTIVEGDHFVMIYGAVLEPPALACGEVGLGANRSDFD
jgi:hypothetical protein